MNKHHIFDLDGTLINSMPNWREVMIRIIDEGKVECPESFFDIITPLGHYETAVYIKNMGVDISVEEILEKIESYAVYEFENKIELKPFAKEYLNKLKNEGGKLYVLTASPHILTDTVLKRCGVYDMFDAVWASDDLGYAKSDPRIYTKVSETIGTDASNITFYDDNLTALTAGAGAGLYTVAVYDESFECDRERLEMIADRYVESFEELI